MIKKREVTSEMKVIVSWWDKMLLWESHNYGRFEFSVPAFFFKNEVVANFKLSIIQKKKKVYVRIHLKKQTYDSTFSFAGKKFIEQMCPKL